MLVALAMIAGGTLAFIAFIGVTGAGEDGHPFGLMDWVVGGVLLGPGFGRLLQWSQQRR